MHFWNARLDAAIAVVDTDNKGPSLTLQVERLQVVDAVTVVFRTHSLDTVVPTDMIFCRVGGIMSAALPVTRI